MLLSRWPCPLCMGGQGRRGLGQAKPQATLKGALCPLWGPPYSPGPPGLGAQPHLGWSSQKVGRMPSSEPSRSV